MSPFLGSQNSNYLTESFSKGLCRSTAPSNTVIYPFLPQLIFHFVVFWTVGQHSNFYFVLLIIVGYN